MGLRSFGCWRPVTIPEAAVGLYQDTEATLILTKLLATPRQKKSMTCSP